MKLEMKPNTALVEVLDSTTVKDKLTNLINMYAIHDEKELVMQQVGAKYSIVIILETGETFDEDNNKLIADLKHGDLCIIADSAISVLDGITAIKKYGFVYTSNIVARISEN